MFVYLLHLSRAITRVEFVIKVFMKITRSRVCSYIYMLIPARLAANADTLACLLLLMRRLLIKTDRERACACTYIYCRASNLNAKWIISLHAQVRHKLRNQYTHYPLLCLVLLRISSHGYTKWVQSSVVKRN